MYTNDIQASLNIQDELDREWISLFGGLEERTGKRIVNPVEESKHEYGKSCVSMNPDCMSCTGNMAAKLNLFKVACLNYTPNPVAYQGKFINRRELVALQKVVSDLAKNSIESTVGKEETRTRLGLQGRESS